MSSCSAIALAVVDAIALKIMLFDSLSVITIIASALLVLDRGSPVIKSIEILLQMRLGIRRGFSRPHCFSLYIVVLPYTSQF